MRCMVALLLLTGMLAGAAAAYDALWVTPGGVTPGRNASITVAAPEEALPGDILVFRCSVAASSTYTGALVALHVWDEAGEVVGSGRVEMTLRPGANTCTVSWDASSLPVGLYTAEFTVDYAARTEPARADLMVRRVSSEDLSARVGAVGERLEALRDARKRMTVTSKYWPLRATVAREWHGKAAAYLRKEQWRELVPALTYLENAVASLEAWLVFGGVAPELQTPIPPIDPMTLEVANGAISQKGRPVFLIGRAGQTDMAWLARHGLNLRAVNLPPRIKADGQGAPKAEYYEEAGVAADGAAGRGIATVVEMDPASPNTWPLERWPEIADKGFVDLTHPGMRAVTEAHLDANLPGLAQRAPVIAVSLANGPRFRFDGEAMRQRFVDHVRGLYPDRLSLNRAWNAHLGSYDDVGIWADYPGYAHLNMPQTEEDWRYQRSNAYQFDWQAFHQADVTAYLEWLHGIAKTVAPNLHTGVALSTEVFELSETRHAPDRESVLRLGAVTFCSASDVSDSPYFALPYPMPPAYYSLLRSIAPENPVLVLGEQLLPDKVQSPRSAAGRVRTALWEGVIAGVDGIALADDSPVFTCPETLEALCATNLDLNRLAPIVDAFQRAPARAGILFSRSAKIFKDGEPHLSSVRDAYEGVSFSGYAPRFLTESQCTPEALAALAVLVLPETPALSDGAFAAIADYAEQGGVLVRVGTPIPYDEHGQSRAGVIPSTPRTVLVRGMNLPTEYLHAMDAATAFGTLPAIPRVVNRHGYPLEGVRSRYIESEGKEYLYLANLRREPVLCHLTGNAHGGRDLIEGRTVRFPMVLPPLDPMLIALEPTGFVMELAATE